MSKMLAGELPYAIAALLAAPFMAVVAAFVLSLSKRPLAAGWIFIGGAAALDLVFGFAIYSLFAYSGILGTGDIGGIVVDMLLGLIFLLLGIKALFTRESPEKAQSRRKRIQKMASGGLGAIFVLGVLGQIVNSDALAIFAGGMKQIAITKVAFWEAAVGILIFIVIMLGFYYLPVVLYTVAPKSSMKMLTPFNEWIMRHAKVVEVVTCLVFGVLFLFKCIQTIVK